MQEINIAPSRPGRVELPPDSLEWAASLKRKIARRSMLIWGEHCTECAWPSCYSTCSLYTPRADLHCRRFENGIERVSTAGASASRQTMRIGFRKLGKLEASGRASLFSTSYATLVSDGVDTAERLLEYLPLAHSAKLRAARKLETINARSAAGGEPLADSDFFVVLCVNEGDEDVRCTLTIRPREGGEPAYQTLLRLIPGISETAVSARDIGRLVDLTQDLLVQIEPVGDGSGARLSFLYLDFARFREARDAALSESADGVVALRGLPPQAHASPKIKCVVWDLDNTLWRGTLIEDDASNLSLNSEAATAIVELDRRGVLQSIASKNNPEEALAKLRAFGLADYFLYPQIGWEEKSRGVAEIARRLNIGLDTFLFIDDQAFERAEVAAAHPQVAVIDATKIKDVLTSDRCDFKVTAESRRRRSMYREEETRDAEQAASAGDFTDFLRGCRLRLVITPLNAASLERAQELTQRTNQLNYSGRRMPPKELEELAAGANGICALLLSSEDRFGDYGTIGCAVVDSERWIVTDFFMSCRVQRKKVDHAFFAELHKRAILAGAESLKVLYRPTPRNGPSLRALTEMGFTAMGESEDATLYGLGREHVVANSDIVSVDARF